MDLQSLNSGTPTTKNWLNPVTGSETTGFLTADKANIGTTVSSIPLSLGTVRTLTTAGPFTFTPIEIVGGVTGFTYNPGGTPTISVTLPSATDLEAYIDEAKLPAYYFEFKVAVNATGVIVAFTAGAGCTFYGGGTSYSVTGKAQISLIFSFLSGAYVIYG